MINDRWGEWWIQARYSLPKSEMERALLPLLSLLQQEGALQGSAEVRKVPQLWLVKIVIARAGFLNDEQN